MNDKYNSDTPLVSITITSYNHGHWIGKAIASALAQDYENLEIIISDNCSIDNSDDVIKMYAKDPRVKYSRNEINIGMIPNFEKVFFALSSGQYIINLSSDDYFVDNSFVSNAMKLVSKYPNIILVFGKNQIFHETTNQISRIPIEEYYNKEFRTGVEAFLDFAKYPYFGWGGCMLNKNKLEELGIHFSENVCADIEINLKMMLHGNVGYVNNYVYNIRVHDSNQTGRVLTAEQYVESRLNMFRNASILYEKIYGGDDKIMHWKDVLLQRDIINISVALLLRTPKEFTYFSNYVKVEYPHYYNVLIKNKKFLFSKYVLSPVLKVKYVRGFSYRSYLFYKNIRNRFLKSNFQPLKS